jgi:uncharacterized membrane protein (UPF0127 family)
VVAARAYRAERWAARAVGLLATPDLAPDEALWIEGCHAVHSVGMRVPIGCAFLDGRGRVMRLVDPLVPRRFAACRGARSVVECHAGVLRSHSGLTRLSLGVPGPAFPAPSEHPCA